MTNGESTEKTVELTQTKDEWQDTSITKIGDTEISKNETLKNIKAGATITVKYENNKVVFTSNK